LIESVLPADQGGPHRGGKSPAPFLIAARARIYWAGSRFTTSKWLFQALSAGLVSRWAADFARQTARFKCEKFL
jgi:hypothetical protein